MSGLFSRIVVDPATGCWLWQGSLDRHGYATNSRHRRVYEAVVGPIPDGLEIDHLCRVENCLYPVHMEPVTKKENILRGFSPAAIHARKTHCLNGHEFNEKNTLIKPGVRVCRICKKMHHRRSRAAARARNDALIEAMQAEIDRLHAALTEAETALRKVEWGGSTFEGEDRCPACFAMKEWGHYQDCVLAAAVSGSKPA